MAAFLDGCRFNPTAGGTTDWTYSSVVPGYQSPAAANVINGALYKYRAESADLSQWELGEGAYNTGTGVLARTTVLFNSSGGTSKINFSTVPQVAVVALAEDLPNLSTRNTYTDTTEATSAGTTAAAIISGGLEVLKKLYVTGIATFKAAVTANGSVSSTGGDANFSAGGNRAFIDLGGSNARVGSLNGGGSALGLQIVVNNSAAITFPSTGEVQVASTTASTSTTTGSLTTAGGLGVAGAAFIGGTTLTVGPGGTGSNPATMRLNSGTGSNSGPSFNLQKNGTNYFGIGCASGLFGGTTNDLVFYGYTTGAGSIAAIGISDAYGSVTVGTNFGTNAPKTVTTSTYTLLTNDSSLIFNGSGTITVTLQAASSYPGRWLYIKNIAALTVLSASSNVVPVNSATAGTTLLGNSAGKWALVQSDGTNWNIMAQN